MNPFLLQAEFARQWFGLATSMASTAMAASTMATERMTAAWKTALAGNAASVPSSAPTVFWPGFGALPTASLFPVFNPFAAAPATTSPFPFAPWMSAWSWAVPTPHATSMYNPLTITWPLAWSGTWPFFPWASNASAPASTGNDLMEQVASSYRTASGYAVAAVMGPFGAALDPRTYGQPWWQGTQKRSLLN